MHVLQYISVRQSHLALALAHTDLVIVARYHLMNVFTRSALELRASNCAVLVRAEYLCVHRRGVAWRQRRLVYRRHH